MREPTRRRVRPCKQMMMMRRQWRRPPNNRQDAKLVSERCLTSNDPSSLPPAKATGTLLVRSFSEEEEDLLIRLHALLGNRWSLITGRLPGRTDEEVKTHWDSQMRTKLKRMSVSPENHRVHPNEREEHRPKHPGHSFFSSSKCGDGVAADDYYATSDAGSSNDRHRQERGLAELNLELTLSTPCIYFGDQENRSRH